MTSAAASMALTSMIASSRWLLSTMTWTCLKQSLMIPSRQTPGVVDVVMDEANDSVHTAEEEVKKFEAVGQHVLEGQTIPDSSTAP